MGAPDPPAIRIKPLGPQHDRGAFCCGNDQIDAFCRDRAQKDHDRYRTRVFVACPDASNVVVGFYSLSVRSIAPRTILNIGFGSWDIPGVYLGMIGVCQDVAKGGIGSALMLDAFTRTLKVAENAGTYCLWLTAIDEERAAWYAARDFVRMEPGKLDMYVPVETIRAVLAE